MTKLGYKGLRSCRRPTGCHKVQKRDRDHTETFYLLLVKNALFKKSHFRSKLTISQPISSSNTTHTYVRYDNMQPIGCQAQLHGLKCLFDAHFSAFFKILSSKVGHISGLISSQVCACKIQVSVFRGYDLCHRG